MERDRDFAAVALPHLDAAYNLARWLAGSGAEAEDIVQEALVRALTYFPGYRGGNARAWLLRIVRNAAYAALNARRATKAEPLWDGDEGVPEPADPGDDPETALIRRRTALRIDGLVEQLPAELKEALVLRELEELSYREIAEVTGAPVGTVMSRLWRARRLLAKAGAGER
ncbi:MAG TPA: sigma-70 family RNA polymerase sigma factor [Stellaceae bacterium]|nr:sigma-70 family RNA polymerase sigma factor [Stellaceae bacterium]